MCLRLDLPKVIYIVETLRIARANLAERNKKKQQPLTITNFRNSNKTPGAFEITSPIIIFKMSSKEYISL